MALALPGIRALDEERTALSVMTFILGGGMSSRLFHTVRERNGLAYSIFAHHAGPSRTPGSSRSPPGPGPKDAAKAVRLSFRELRKMAARPVPASELAAAKSAMIGRLLRSTETAMASARFYASRWRARMPLETPDDRAAAIPWSPPRRSSAIAERIVAGIDQVRLAFVGPSDQGQELLDAALDARAA